MEHPTPQVALGLRCNLNVKGGVYKTRLFIHILWIRVGGGSWSIRGEVGKTLIHKMWTQPPHTQNVDKKTCFFNPSLM